MATIQELLADESLDLRFMRLPEVITRTGLSRSTIYNLMKAGKFPANVKLSARASAWLESDVKAWMIERIPAQQVIERPAITELHIARIGCHLVANNKKALKKRAF